MMGSHRLSLRRAALAGVLVFPILTVSAPHDAEALECVGASRERAALELESVTVDGVVSADVSGYHGFDTSLQVTGYDGHDFELVALRDTSPTSRDAYGDSYAKR